MILQMIDEIKRDIENGCYISALALALTLPDTCGKSEYPNDKPGDRYIKWFDKYVDTFNKSDSPYMDDMPYESGELIYSLRNNLLHQGTPNIEKNGIKDERNQVNHFTLLISDVFDSGAQMVAYGAQNEVKERNIEVSIYHLCSKICGAAKDYYNKNQDKFDFIYYEIKDVRNGYKELFEK